MVVGLASKSESAASSASKLLGEYLGLLLEDIDLFSAFAASPYSSHYPARHSLHVAMLSMAMGAKAGLDRTRVEDLGLGALLHDLGMLRVPRALWKQRNALSDSQRLDVMQHPIYTIEALDGQRALKDTVRLICYQVHERAGGQGYPRAIPNELIHPLSRIASVADAYVGMVSARPYRAAIQPYRAIEAIVKQVGEGLFDPMAARLLLETLSLYPVGSYVMLSDRRFGKVLRSNGAVYDRPIVRAWPPRTPPDERTGELVDLRDANAPRVIEALPAPTM